MENRRKQTRSNFRTESARHGIARRRTGRSRTATRSWCSKASSADTIILLSILFRRKSHKGLGQTIRTEAPHNSVARLAAWPRELRLLPLKRWLGWIERAQYDAARLQFLK